MKSDTPRIYTGPECRAALLRAFPEEVLVAIVRQVLADSRKAVEIYNELDVSQRQRLGTLAGFRRALIETGLKKIRERYKLDHALDLKAGRGATVLLLNGDVGLTLRFGSIAKTGYNETLARSNMPDLYGNDPNPIPEEADLLYGIIRYRLSRKDPQHLTSVEVVFPGPGMKGIVDVFPMMPLYHAWAAAEHEAQAAQDLVDNEQKARVKLRSKTRKDRKKA